MGHREPDAAYRTLAASLPDAFVVVFDADLRVRMAQGGTPDALAVAVDDELLVDAFDPASRQVVLDRALAALTGERFEFSHVSPRTGREYRVTLGPLLEHAPGQRPRGLAVWHDVTERNEAQRRLQHLADHDALTGLLNRRCFEQELERHLALVHRYGPSGAVLVIDIDHFKYVNDTLGHRAGDDLIVLVADALRTRLRQTDVLARLGGDEFAVLLPRADAAGAEVVATALVEDLRGHVRDGEHLRSVTASIGVAVVSGREETGDELLTAADLAMYDAKENGRDRHAVFTAGEGHEPNIRRRVRWLDRIRAAVDARDETQTPHFVLHGQPIVDLESRDVVAHELLLRMVGDDGALIPPIAFLPVAERFGAVQAIDSWVIDHAAQLAAGHRSSFAINLSAKSLARPDLVEDIAAAVARHGVDPRLLTFEITETAAVTNVGLARRLADGLHDLGCRLSLDDFGAGFGSFYYLKHLPFDVVKIDGEFVSGCTTNRTDQLVIDAVVRMADGLGKDTVAEFTGDAETAAFLQDAGVRCAQGFYLGRPEPMTGEGAPDTRPALSTRP